MSLVLVSWGATDGDSLQCARDLLTDLLLFIGRAHEVLGGDGPRLRRDEAVDALLFAHGFVLLLAAVAL